GGAAQRRGRYRQIAPGTGAERAGGTGRVHTDRVSLLALLPKYRLLSGDRASAAAVTVSPGRFSGREARQAKAGAAGVPPARSGDGAPFCRVALPAATWKLPASDSDS